VAYIGNQPTTTAFLTDTFSANGSGTVFTLSAAPANTNSIIVAVSGVLQDPSTYSVSGTALTFSAAPPAGTGNISVRFLGIPASGIVNTAYRTQTEFTATAGQTTFSVPSYTVGFIDVYRNGALLGSADFTATNGTTVVLAAGASAGDLVETVSFFVSSVLNAIPATAGAVNSTYLLDGSVTQAKLSTNVAGNGPAFSAYKSGVDQGITTATWTKVQLNSEDFDTANCFDNTTNYRFTPTVAGYYQINAAVHLSNNSDSILQTRVAIYKNGTSYRYANVNLLYPTYAIINDATLQVSALIYMNGSSDYLELYCYEYASGTPIIVSTISTCLNGTLARTA
jgi:hypothetical protein